MKQDIAEIAGKLTKAQREWLATQEPTLNGVKVVPCAEWWDCPPLYVTIKDTDHWLAQQSMSSPEGVPGFTEGETKLYPLGLAVRAHLLAYSHPEKQA